MGEKSQRIVPASEILAKIERGEDVEYDNVIVKGDLDLGDKTLGTVHFRDAIFQGSVNFGGTNFTGSASFIGANFSARADFGRSKFSGYADFLGAEFGGDANFGGAEFTGGYTYFLGAEFAGGNADFGGAKFTGGDANFGGAEFTGGYTYFVGAEFAGGNADFVGAEFAGGNADFRGAKFTGGYANFGGAKFTGGNADFRGAKFTGGYANFWRAKFAGGNADFLGAEFGGYANFLGAEFDKELTFNDLKFDRLYITWESIKDKLVYNGPAYLALVKNFKVIEQFNDADNCYYAYRKASQAQKLWYSEDNRVIDLLVRCYSWIYANIKRISEYFSWINNYPPLTWIRRFTWSKLFDWIGLVSCGYGVKVWPIILWGLGSVLGFTLLYRLLPESYGRFVESGPSTITIEALNNSTHILTLVPGDNIVSPSWGECLYFSFTALTGGTPEGLHPAGVLRYAVMIENVLGYTFLALFVVVLARKLIR